MRIDNSHLAGVGRADVSAFSEAGQLAQKGETRTDKTVQVSEHVRAPELERLRQQLSLVPEVRLEEITRVAMLIQKGHYFTPEMARKTADSMIQAIE